MKHIQPKIRRMTYSEQVEYGYCSQGLMMEHREHVYKLSSGTTDSIYVFQAGAVLYVLTVNKQLNYVALDYYIGSEIEPIDTVFLQGQAAKELLGHDWHSLPLSTLSTKLIHLFS